jgi:hypothetical protein
MFANNRLWIPMLLGLLCFSPNAIHGQGGTGFRIGEEVDGDFQVSTGISIGLTGAKYFYEFSLVDENGFAYDTWSLVGKQQVVEHAELSTAQVEAMGLIRSATQKELIAGLPKHFSSDESKAEFEQIFRDAENQMRDVLNADQQVHFDQAKNQLNIQKVGFAKFLAARAMRETIGLKEAEVESLATSATEIEAKSKKLVQDVFRELNLQLIEQLSEKQSASFDEWLSEDGKDQYLNQRLFPDNSPRKKVRKIPTTDFLRLLIRSKKTREEIELTEAQLDEIRALKARRDAESDKGEEQKNEIKQVLNENQYRKLMALTVQKEAARWGTVNAICGGTLRDLLHLSDEDSQRLFESGLKINDGLQVRIQKSKLDLWKDSLREISPASQQKIMTLIGKPIFFESK